MSTSDELLLLKELYLPPADEFVLVEVPEMQFVMIDGEGDHATEAFAGGTQWLFSVIDPIKPVAKERMGKNYVEPPSSLGLGRFAEGTSVQIMHVGPEGDAVPTMARLFNEFLPQNHLVATGYFHEIYLSDPKRVEPEKLKTVLRQPVAHVVEGG